MTYLLWYRKNLRSTLEITTKQEKQFSFHSTSLNNAEKIQAILTSQTKTTRTNFTTNSATQEEASLLSIEIFPNVLISARSAS